jgi:glycerol kinase
MLLNLQTLTWDTALLELFAIPHQLLPVVVPCGVTTPMGHTDVDGLPRGIPVHAMAGDQQAALFGQVCVRAGMAKNTYGTGCFMLMNTGAQPKASAHRLLATVGWQWDHQTTYALEGSVFVAGAAIQWLRDGLGVIQHAADIGPLAESVSDAGGVTFVPALSGLGAPHWRPHARGAIAGITRGTTRAHLARATLEAIAFQSTELVDAMAQDAEVALQELRVDGGASRCDLLMQMQADFAQVPVVRAAVSETTALGAAFFAGLGCGLWKGVEEIAALWRADRVFYPAIPAAQAAARLARWRESVAQTPSAHP